jgi:hypothetical protein
VVCSPGLGLIEVVEHLRTRHDGVLGDADSKLLGSMTPPARLRLRGRALHNLD